MLNHWQLQKKLSQGSKAFTLVEIMIVVLIIGILLAIAVPNFVRARETSRKKTCAANLRRLQYAKDAYMMQNNKPPTTPESEFTDIVLYGTGATSGYLNQKPQCPGSGTYTLGSGSVLPTCNYNGGANFSHTYDGD